MSKIESIAEGELGAFDAAHAGTVQLLVFTAANCGPCRAMAPAIEDIAEIYADEIAVGRIAVDTAPELGERFGVRAVPTLIVRRGGEEVERSLGALNKTRIAAMLDGALDGGSRA